MTSIRPSSRNLLLIGALAGTLLSPARLRSWALRGGQLVPADLPAGAAPVAVSTAADLDHDGLTEQVTLDAGRAAILRQGRQVWVSPAGWTVVQAAISDLDGDARPELALLVWRRFAAWPIDAYLPHPGRIQAFHDQAQRSCHLILIAWRRGAFVERWAGSALADPLTAIAAADVDGDGRAELLALEGHYDGTTARSITLWSWNGFGFTLIARGPSGRYRALIALQPPTGPDLVLAQADPGGP